MLVLSFKVNEAVNRSAVTERIEESKGHPGLKDWGLVDGLT